MKIEIVAMFYNDEFLAPFFAKHYAFADRIRAIIDIDTTDRTVEILSKYENISIEYFKFPAGFDSDSVADKFNTCYRDSVADWMVVVDSDEFIFDTNFRNVLEDEKDDILFVRFFQVYRHANDIDLDSNLPIKMQRRHGDANAVGGQNRKGMKPIVVRTGKTIRWMAGQHKIWNRHLYKTSNTIISGVHWMMADPIFSIARRLRGKIRHSQKSKDRGHNVHFNITEEEVRLELEKHIHDNQLF